MTTPNVFYPHAISADVYQGGNLFQFTDIFDVQPSHNFQDLVEFAAAQVGPQFTGTHQASPDNRFGIRQMTTLLSVTIPGDYYISRRLDNHIVDLHYKAGQNLGMRYSDIATAHFRMRNDRSSMLVLESLSVDQGGLLEARCRLVHIFDGTIGTDPLVPVTGVALTATSTVGLLHTLGPIRLNGTLLKGVTSLRLDNNIVYDEEASHGDSFLTYCGIKNYRPVMTLRTRQTDYLATFGSRGVPLTGLSCYFRNKLASGINEADANPFHILLSNSGWGTVKARSIQGDNSQAEISIDLLQSSQNTAAYALAINQPIT